MLASVQPMLAGEEYQLLDFGGGRRLERFGPITLDRPCPVAELLEPTDPDAWARAAARFEGRENERGVWTDRRVLPQRWIIRHGSLGFELKRTDFGHVGLFPEQVVNWEWLAHILSPLPLGEDQGEGPYPLPISQRDRGDSLLPLCQRERETP